MRSAYTFDTELRVQEELKNMIYKRSDPAMILVERSIYVFGGDTLHAGKCEVYSIDDDKWRKIK